MSDQPIHVLLVDDDEDDYIITRDLLDMAERQTYVLDWTPSYESAIEKLEQGSYSVFLVDYRLGQHNGLEFLEHAAQIGSDAPTIILTGHGDMEVDTEAVKAGAADYLVKGQIGPDLLERSIRHSIERKKIEIERSTLEQQLIQTQKLESIGQLAGGIAHDFNNIMTPILGYAELSLSTLPEERKEHSYVMEICSAAEKAKSLIQQLLAFSRQQIVDPRVVDLNNVIAEMEGMLRRLINEDIELLILPGQGRAVVKLDPSQLEQVLMNLIVNARDAMLTGGTIIVETAIVSFDQSFTRHQLQITPGDYVMLAVSDNGSGMTQQVLSHIFDPFYTTKDEGKGTGLGLSTCHGIIAQNNGQIAVYSEPDKGTTFKVYLPYVGETPDYSNSSKNDDHLPRGDERVLLVEDEDQVRGLTARVLRQQGYEVLEASNGIEALKIARDFENGELHLLITDVVMPLMGGKDLANSLSDSHASTKVLYTSGYTDEAISRYGVLEPGINFVQKPYSLGALTQNVRRVLDDLDE